MICVCTEMNDNKYYEIVQKVLHYEDFLVEFLVLLIQFLLGIKIQNT